MAELAQRDKRRREKEVGEKEEKGGGKEKEIIERREMGEEKKKDCGEVGKKTLEPMTLLTLHVMYIPTNIANPNCHELRVASLAMFASPTILFHFNREWHSLL